MAFKNDSRDVKVNAIKTVYVLVIQLSWHVNTFKRTPKNKKSTKNASIHQSIKQTGKNFLVS